MNESIDAASAYAQKYLEDLLSFFGLNASVTASHDGQVIQLDIPTSLLNGFLIGQHGDTMRALQYLVSTALKNNDFSQTRVNVDVADYKKQRADHLRERAIAWMEQVKASGEPLDLEPMNASDRRVVHQLAVEYGLTSDSAGDGPGRHIVLKPSAS